MRKKKIQLRMKGMIKEGVNLLLLLLRVVVFVLLVEEGVLYLFE
jgi:hypothetical protein